jgi:hypothetical protein
VRPRTTDSTRVAAQRSVPSRASTTISDTPALTLISRNLRLSRTQINRPVRKEATPDADGVKPSLSSPSRDQDRQTSASNLQTATTNNRSQQLANVNTRRRLSVTDENVASYPPVRRLHRSNHPPIIVIVNMYVRSRQTTDGRSNAITTIDDMNNHNLPSSSVGLAQAPTRRLS